jgi:hypothetical protein
MAPEQPYDADQISVNVFYTVWAVVFVSAAILSAGMAVARLPSDDCVEVTTRQNAETHSVRTCS